MSTFNASGNQYAAPQSKSLGVAGFICSLIGIFTGGLLSPVGLILSLVALGRRPRGFAIAGVVIGALGTCGGVIAILVFGALILAMLGIGVAAAFLALNDPQRMELTVDMANIAEAVERSKHDSGYLPASLTSLNLASDTLTDPWGHPYAYHFTDAAAPTTAGSVAAGSTGTKKEDPGFDIISAGADGQEGTKDDVKLSQLDELWANYIKFQSTTGKDGSGNVRIKVGDREINLEGGPDGGHVKIHTEDGRVIELSGDQAGGRITTTSTPATPPVPGTPEAGQK